MKRILLIILLSYFLFCLLLYVLQRKLEYLPSGKLEKPASYGLYEISHETLISYDDTELSLWFKKPNNERKEVMVYFHGNAGNLGDRADKLNTFSKYTDYGLAALSYRGYPGSGGSPSEEAFIRDAQWLITFLESQGYQAKDMILYGESLGAAIAIRLAAEYPVKAIILEAPFYSAVEVAKQAYWYVPADLLMKDKYESYKYARKITSPTLIFHGTDDRVTSIEQSRKLFKLLPYKERKKIEVKEAGHLEFDAYFLIKEVVTFMAGNKQ